MGQTLAQRFPWPSPTPIPRPRPRETGPATAAENLIRFEPLGVTYISAGLGVQDAAAAWSIYQRAEALGVGQSVDWPRSTGGAE